MAGDKDEERATRQGGASSNPLRQLATFGQSVWLDFIDRPLLESGDLGRFIANDGVTGITSNPAIFEKAITQQRDYDRQIAEELSKPNGTPGTAYDAVVASDVAAAADLLLPVYQARGGRDGYVSVEVSPALALNSAETVHEARRLWTLIDKPNLMIKVPGTEAGVSALRQLIEEGINVNVTLLFSVERYKAVLDAYIAGLQDRSNRGMPIDQVAGVASFFVSRIDVAADNQIDERIRAGAPDAQALTALKGKLAIANAKIAYQHFLEVHQGTRWRILADKGALAQRLLWASTGTKNADYSDVIYVENLIGPDTINTVPPLTMDAFRDHGVVSATLADSIDEAKRHLASATALGINLDAITAELLSAGVLQFAEAATRTLDAIEGKKQTLLTGSSDV